MRTCQWLQGGLCSKQASFHSHVPGADSKAELVFQKVLCHAGFTCWFHCRHNAGMWCCAAIPGGSWGTQEGRALQQVIQPFCKDKALKTQNSRCPAGLSDPIKQSSFSFALKFFQSLRSDSLSATCWKHKTLLFFLGHTSVVPLPFLSCTKHAFQRSLSVNLWIQQEHRSLPTNLLKQSLTYYLELSKSGLLFFPWRSSQFFV